MNAAEDSLRERVHESRLFSDPSTSESSQNHPNQQQRTPGLQYAIEYMQERKLESLLWLTRVGTIVFTVLSLFPLISANTYRRALISNAAASSLHLHNRGIQVELSHEFLACLFTEDSFHYLIYSLLFIFNYPGHLSLLPIFLNSLLNSVNYSMMLVNKLGLSNTIATKALTTIISNRRSILRLISWSEVCLMGVVIFRLLSGKDILLTIFAYARFLIFRYESQRNPYTRAVFHEMRIIIENFANAPDRNVELKNFCHKIIRFFSYFVSTRETEQ